jgi:hypothetical protein
MTALAFLFVESLVRQDFIDQAKRAARIDTMLYPDPPPSVGGRDLSRFQEVK